MYSLICHARLAKSHTARYGLSLIINNYLPRRINEGDEKLKQGQMRQRRWLSEQCWVAILHTGNGAANYLHQQQAAICRMLNIYTTTDWSPITSIICIQEMPAHFLLDINCLPILIFCTVKLHSLFICSLELNASAWAMYE